MCRDIANDRIVQMARVDLDCAEASAILELFVSVGESPQGLGG